MRSMKNVHLLPFVLALGAADEPFPGTTAGRLPKRNRHPNYQKAKKAKKNAKDSRRKNR